MSACPCGDAGSALELDPGRHRARSRRSDPVEQPLPALVAVASPLARGLLATGGSFDALAPRPHRDARSGGCKRPKTCAVPWGVPWAFRGAVCTTVRRSAARLRQPLRVSKMRGLSESFSGWFSRREDRLETAVSLLSGAFRPLTFPTRDGTEGGDERRILSLTTSPRRAPRSPLHAPLRPPIRDQSNANDEDPL